MQTEWIGILSAVLGGIGVKIVDHVLKRDQTALKDAKTIRDELRLELAELKKEMIAHKKELESWRVKYYELLQENLVMEKHIERLENEIKDLKDSMT